MQDIATSEAANSFVYRPYIGDSPRVAEFFAGIGLVGKALEQAGFNVVFSSDIDPVKEILYRVNRQHSHFLLADIHSLKGADIPEVELATASFPCTDLSLAGNRAGLLGQNSGTFWEFARILEEMGARRPPVVLLENVVGFATSRNGDDLNKTISKLNELGYTCDVLMLDAKWFVPQSRPRLFIIGSQLLDNNYYGKSLLRPSWLVKFIKEHPDLGIRTSPLTPPPLQVSSLETVVERLEAEDPRWWEEERLNKFLSSLSSIQMARLHLMKESESIAWASAYRRTRNGKAVWEIRADAISGCLRTARGGSSKQALVEAGKGAVKVRWMTVTEYARLQGVPDFELSDVRESQAYFALGDAVCVPAVSWLGREYLMPLISGTIQTQIKLLDVMEWPIN